MAKELYSHAEKIGVLLTKNNHKLVTAESCTGGWVSKIITDVPGSSVWFESGIITYSDESKMRCLGVSEDTLGFYGAVSKETVQEMIAGAIEHSGAQSAIAVTGVAGPGGGSTEKPVGTVWLGWQIVGNLVETQLLHLSGDRDEIREQTVAIALRCLIEAYENIE